MTLPLPGRALPAILLFFAPLGTVGGAICRADILAGDYANGGVYRFEDDGTPRSGGIPIGSAGLDGTAGLAIGPDGNIYASSQNTGDVLIYDGATGAPICLPLSPGCANPGFFTSLDTPTRPNSTPGVLRFGPDGDLYVADFGGSTVRRYNAEDAAFVATAAFGLGPSGAIAFRPNGDLWVSNFGSSAIIEVHNGVQKAVILSDNGFLEAPSSLLFLPNDNLLVVSMFSNKVERYHLVGTKWEHRGTFAEIEPLVTGDPEWTNYPSDIVFDQDGNLLLAVLGNDYNNAGQILRYSYDDGIAGTWMEIVADHQPPLGSVAWIRSPDAVDGDFNGDGSVGSDDYQKWKDDYGKWVAKGGGADGNGDGIVNAADYTVWRNAITSIGQAATSATVPEPAVGVLFACSFSAVLLSRRRTCASPQNHSQS